MDLERLVGGALLLAELVEFGEQTRQVGRVTTAVQPAVTPGRPPEGGCGVAADQDGQRLRGHRAELDRPDVVALAVELEVPTGGQAAHDGDGLVHAPAPTLPRHADQLVVLGPGAGPDPEGQPVVGQDGDRRGLLGHDERMAHRQLQHEGDEADPLRHRPHGRDQRERLEERLAVEEFTGAVGIERIGRVRHLRIAEAVGDHHRVVARLLDRPGQGQVVGRVDHRLRIREPHQASLHSTWARSAPSSSIHFPPAARAGFPPWPSAAPPGVRPAGRPRPFRSSTTTSPSSPLSRGWAGTGPPT